MCVRVCFARGSLAEPSSRKAPDLVAESVGVGDFLEFSSVYFRLTLKVKKKEITIVCVLFLLFVLTLLFNAYLFS